MIGGATWSVCTFSYYYWWPSREAAKPPGVFVPFLIIIIGGQAAKPPGVFVPFLIRGQAAIGAKF